MLIKLTPLVIFINNLRTAFAKEILAAKKLPSQTVIREKLSKALLYENGTHKLLIKLTYCQLLWNLENPILVDIAELKF